jgi:hypothetical protein
MLGKFHNPKSVIEMQKLLSALNKKYKGKDFSKDEGILVSHELMSDICLSIIDLQNRVTELEEEND